MKNIFSIVLLLLTNTLLAQNKSLKNQSWSLYLSMLNSDTAFMQGSPEVTYRHAYKFNTGTKTKEDSLKVSEKSKKSYENLKKIEIFFATDSTYKMTKVRSGGKFFENEMDEGVYKIKNDTIFIVNKTRKNSRFVLLISEKQDKLYFEDKFPNHILYWEYRKKTH